MPRRISTDTKMTFEKFKTTFGPIIDMAEGVKKDQFLVAEYKRNMVEIARKEELIAKAKLETEAEVKAIEDGLKLGEDEESE